MSDEEDAPSAEAILSNANEIYRRDRRVAMLVDSAVVHARSELGRYIDPENADEEAFRLAQRACAILASRIFTEDAELAALRLDRDRYKELAERCLMFSPEPQVILRDSVRPGDDPGKPAGCD